MTNFVDVTYQQTGKSLDVNSLGMREMQQRAFEERNAQYLLLKAPPASGKSRALMFLGLDNSVSKILEDNQHSDLSKNPVLLLLFLSYSSNLQNKTVFC